MLTKKNKPKKSFAFDFDDLLDQAIVLGSSLVYLTKDSADAIVDEMEKRELISSDKGKKMAEDLKSNFKDRKERLHIKVKNQLKKVLDNLGIVTKEDLEQLKKNKA